MRHDSLRMAIGTTVLLVLVGCAPGAPLHSAPVPDPPPTTTAAAPVPRPVATTSKRQDADRKEPAPTRTVDADLSYSASDVQEWLAGKEPPGRRVFLTFDDGPNHDVTPRILDILRREGVHATFFVGDRISDAPDVIKRIVAEGHCIGLHSYSHDYKRLYPSRHGSAENIRDEATRSMQALGDVLGDGFTTSAWRYPGGHMSWEGLTPSDAELKRLGLDWVDWNAMTGDAEPKSRRPTTAPGMEELATRAITDERPAAVVLAHDSPGKELTVEALPGIIHAYKQAHYQFATIG